MKKQNIKILGTEEWCALNNLKIPAILARIDSGAKTSSIQATDIELIKKNNENWVRFVIHPLRKNHDASVICRAKLIGKRSIRGSFGISEERLIIKTPITIGEETFDIELSLANRENMVFRMLLGREAMIGRYLIDPSEKNLQKVYSKKEIEKIYKT